MTTISPNRNIIIISAFLIANREAKVAKFHQIKAEEKWSHTVIALKMSR